MPSIRENIQFLYLVLTQGGPLTIDWDPICTALSLEKGAATKRWSRLKQAMGQGDEPAVSSYELLWLMVKHSTRTKAYDWDKIAEVCNSTKGACSKRYSRLKIAFERGDEVPSTPRKSNKSAPSTPKKTPSKTKAKSEDDGDGTPTTTPKRKRTPAKKNIDYAEAEDDEEEDEKKRKRAKSTPKSKPRPKNAFRASDEKKPSEEPQTVVKDEPVESEGEIDEVFVPFSLNADGADTSFSNSVFSEKFTHARDMADVLLNRKTALTKAQRQEVESMLDVFGDAV